MLRARFGLAVRFGLAAGLLAVFAVFVTALLQAWLWSEPLLAIALAALLVAPVGYVAMRSQLQPLLAIFRALGGTVSSYRDGDYSFGLHWERDDEIGDLVQSHNALGDVLREQRLGLVQRELLLDTMVQNTPVAMLLVQDTGTIVFANIAARQLLGDGRRMEGMSIDQLLRRTFAPLREALDRGGDGLFTVTHAKGSDAEDEIYHLARQAFTLNGRKHELLLLRHLTAELRRQEVQTWKKVIRVISHELNNSLAPVASLASSAAELVRRNQTQRLPEILATVEERTRHLERFIEGYAKFAKLPAPRKEPVPWPAFVRGLQLQVPFRIAGDLPPASGHFDAPQMEQAILNLLKNAHESGSVSEEVCLAVRRAPGDQVLV
ncbi:MAG TPA: PAS domain-containing protein, partial [Ramlibacter sp.]|nr:PAS domain-containing protein [Ramlibacter sp.]